jgi:hypothetical protein
MLCAGCGAVILPGDQIVATPCLPDGREPVYGLHQRCDSAAVISVCTGREEVETLDTIERRLGQEQEDTQRWRIKGKRL